MKNCDLQIQKVNNFDLSNKSVLEKKLQFQTANRMKEYKDYLGSFLISIFENINKINKYKY